MAIKAQAEQTLINLTDGVGITSVHTYYKTQPVGNTPPVAPTSIIPLPPTGWTNTEPTYVAGSDNVLYVVDLTLLDDGSFVYTPVSVSSSYEAAKQANVAAKAAQDSADAANDLLDGKITSVNILLNSIDSDSLKDGTIKNEKLAVGCVTAESIQNGAIGSDQLAENAVGDRELKLGAIAANKLNISNHLIY